MNVKNLIMLVVFFVCLFFIMGMGIFVNKNNIISLLEKQGYTNITITDRRWFAVGLDGCPSQYAAQFKARVSNQTGNEKELIVCVEWPTNGMAILVK